VALNIPTISGEVVVEFRYSVGCDALLQFRQLVVYT